MLKNLEAASKKRRDAKVAKSPVKKDIGTKAPVEKDIVHEALTNMPAEMECATELQAKHQNFMIVCLSD